MSRKTLNATNLEALGPKRLSALLLEVSTGSADIKRRLRLELSHNLGPAELAQDVRKRLATLRKSTSFVGWRKRRALIKDLNLQLTMIVEKIAPEDPGAALDLLWSFVELAPFVYARTDDSRGEIRDVFEAAITHFEDLAPRAHPPIDDLADRVWAALQDNDYGEWDGIVARVAPALGKTGLLRLKGHVEAFAADTDEDGPQDPPAAQEHAAIRFLRDLRDDENRAADLKARFVKDCLQDIAAAMGDTDAYIAQYSMQERKRKKVAAEIALLLLNDGQPEAALHILQDASEPASRAAQHAWDDTYIAALTALGREHSAQNHRWACFERTLRVAPLRDHLARLPDFEDLEAEDRAREHVLSAPDFAAALAFCLEWPDLLTAAALIETRLGDETGDHPPLFAQATEALRPRHPRAAALLLRRMIDTALARNQTARFAIAAEYLADCAALDGDIQDYGPFETHLRYLNRLQTEYGHVAAFWKIIS